MEITNEDNMELMARYEDNHFDLAIVDPPYGIKRFQEKRESKQRGAGSHVKSGEVLKWDIAPNFQYFTELFRVSKNQIIWGANNFDLPTSEYFLIWDKKQTVPNFATAELAFVSMGLKTPAKIYQYGIHKHNHVNKIHPTQKPVSLYEFCLDTYAKEGDKILDTHLGSGSIAIACHNRKFDLTACELDKEYFDSAMKRLYQHKKQLTLF